MTISKRKTIPQGFIELQVFVDEDRSMKMVVAIAISEIGWVGREDDKNHSEIRLHNRETFFTKLPYKDLLKLITAAQ